MGYDLAYHSNALAYLESLPIRFRRQISEKIKALSDNAHPPGTKQLQSITDGGNPIYRLRSGDFRVLYSVRDGGPVVILDIGNRKDIYRRGR